MAKRYAADRQTDRHTDRQTDRQTDRTDRQIDRQTESQTDRTDLSPIHISEPNRQAEKTYADLCLKTQNAKTQKQ